MKLWIIFFASILTNNIVLTYFLGICPFLAMTAQISTAAGMGFAVTFVMTMTCAIIWPINHFLLAPFNAQYLQLIVYILVIAVLVQVVELVIDRYYPVLYARMGVFLSLITVNCAILGVALFMTLRNYGYIESIVFSTGSGIGWMIAAIAMAGARAKLRFSNIPEPLKGMGISLVIAAILSMGFMGFAGWINLR